MNKTHDMSALMFFTMCYLTKKREPDLEEFLFAGYSKASYYRVKKDFNAKKIYLLRDFKEDGLE